MFFFSSAPDYLDGVSLRAVLDDPAETTNHAQDPKKAALVAELRSIVARERVD